MNKPYPSSERGQAVVLIVLAMVVLLGFTALAVDGSMIYSDRRFSQSAADASSLAGGSTAAQTLEDYGVVYKDWTANPPTCTGDVEVAAKKGRTAAVKRAKDNSFTIDQDISDDMGVETVCGVEPLYAVTKSGGKVKIFDDKYMDMHTVITKQTQTAFAHFVFSGPMVNTVTAVTRVRPRQPLAFGYAIVALNDDLSNCNKNGPGVNYHGLGGNKGDLTVDGGGVFSNGCMDVDGNVSVTVNDGPVLYFGTANKDDLDAIKMGSGNPAQLANATDRIPPELYNVPAPNCGAGTTLTASQFVKYSSDHGGDPLPSGLYCITGDVKINGGDTVKGYGVTLYMTGSLTVNGGASVDLTAPAATYSGPAIPGVVIYAPKSNPGPFQINGGSSSTFRGTILAPGADVDLSGNAGSNAFEAQVIAWNVNVGGASGTYVQYDSDRQASKPTAIDLYR